VHTPGQKARNRHPSALSAPKLRGVKGSKTRLGSVWPAGRVRFDSRCTKYLNAAFSPQRRLIARTRCDSPLLESEVFRHGC